jgi:hypothetical protein
MIAFLPVESDWFLPFFTESDCLMLSNPEFFLNMFSIVYLYSNSEIYNDENQIDSPFKGHVI